MGVLQPSYQNVSILWISSDPEYSSKTIGFLIPILQIWKLRYTETKSIDPAMKHVSGAGSLQTQSATPKPALSQSSHTTSLGEKSYVMYFSDISIGKKIKINVTAQRAMPGVWKSLAAFLLKL